ncbi:MAG: double zinc ribbon domain-containing protein [Oscillospiraceae bacterium]|nr:double zinc ribbon domain-containing protein [Oscillospiraceae bacterium]
MRSNMNALTRFVLDIFYPNRCPCCDAFIKWDKLVCAKCHRELEVVYDKTCHRCGKEVCICSDSLQYEAAVCAFRYSELCREGILSLKRGNNKNFGEYSGKLISYIMQRDYPDESFDIIVPVPMSRASYAQRGYNQAEIIASEISHFRNIPVRSDILYKSGSQTSQHFLSKSQRIKNVSSFGIRQIDLTGKSVILCDDVITTASTVNRCAALLKSAGAGKILLACAAQSKMK